MSKDGIESCAFINAFKTYEEAKDHLKKCRNDPPLGIVSMHYRNDPSYALYAVTTVGVLEKMME